MVIDLPSSQWIQGSLSASFSHLNEMFSFHRNFLLLLSCSEKEGKHETQKYDLYNQLRGKNNLFSNRLGRRDFPKTLTSLNVETINFYKFPTQIGAGNMLKKTSHVVRFLN